MKNKKFFIFLLFLMLSTLSAKSLEDFEPKEYVKTEWYILEDPYPEQNEAFPGSVFIVVKYFPNIKPKPTGVFYYYGKYPGNLNPFVITGDGHSMIRYTLYDFSKDKGFTGSPTYRLKKESPSMVNDAKRFLVNNFEGYEDISYKGYVMFEAEVEFNP